MGSGNSRVTLAVLRHRFDKFYAVEPSPKMRERAVKSMEEAGLKFEKLWGCTMEDVVLPIGLKFDAVWIQFTSMYFSDGDFIKYLKLMRNHLKPNGLVFIKENVASDDTTFVTEGEFKGKTDRSLVRSTQCFNYIIASAGFRSIMTKYFDPTNRDYSIFTTTLRSDHQMATIPRHPKNCAGKNTPMEWTSTKESKPPIEETKAPPIPPTTVEKVETKEKSNDWIPDMEFYKKADTRVQFIENMYYLHVFHGDVNISVNSVKHQTKSNKPSTKTTVVDACLNLHCPISHPKFRNMLTTIKVLASMCMQVTSTNRRILELTEQLPYFSTK